MTKKPFREQLSKFSLLGQLPKVETGLEEAWENLKKCTEPFTAQDIIKQQQETIESQKAEIERLNNTIYTFEKHFEFVKAEAVREFAERLKDYYIKNKRYDRPYAHTMICLLFALIDEIVEEMVG